MQTNPGFDPVFLVMMLILSIPIAVAGWWLAPKMKANRWLWAILLALPFLNWIIFPIFIIRIFGYILDRINGSTMERKDGNSIIS